MTTDLALRDDVLLPTVAEERGGITPVAALQRRMELILDAMSNALEAKKDYGLIPGTDKPSVYLSGAQKLCLLFQLAAADPMIDELTTDERDAIRYRVRVPLLSPSGRVLAVGVGEASTDEEKYKWRKAVCDPEFDETPVQLRREKWHKGNPPYKVRQVRTVPADLANTVLKMAHKRALIHATLTATGASSVFNQDLEHFTAELAESLVEGDDETRAERAIAPPQRRAPSSSTATPASATTATGLLVQCAKAGPQWLIGLKDDARDFTTRDDAIGTASVALLNKRVTVTFTTKQGERRTFYNVSALAAAPAEAPSSSTPSSSTPTTPASSAPPLTADRIPFGG